MTLKMLTLLLFSFVCFWSPAKAETLSPQGYGQIKFGTKLKVIETRLKQVGTPRKRDFDCDYVMFKKYPGLAFMVEKGVITRADAKDGIKNSAGVTVGDSLEKVKHTHADIRIEPHKYDEFGHYLILSSADNHAAILFEESGGKVTRVRAGIRPSVEYVEGCL